MATPHVPLQRLRDVYRAVCVLVAASVLIPAAVWALQCDLAYYRGLSGLDSALFVFVALTLFRHHRLRGDQVGVLLACGFLVGFVLKVTYELVAGQTIFVTGMGPGVVGVPLAHIVGATVGAALSVSQCWPR